MGRGGGGGGGRSFGGGGGRSFGGRSPSSGRGGGSFGGSSGRGGGSFGSGGFGSSRPPSGGRVFAPRVFVNTGSRTSYGGGPPSYSGGGMPPPNNGNYNRNGGNSWTIWVVIFFVAIFVGIVLLGNSNSFEITPSTLAREPLPSSAVNETAYFTDELNWIGNKGKLEQGMKTFYKKTGVQPYLIITDEVDGSTQPTNEQAEAFLTRFYDETFTDEAHIVVLFHEYTPSQYSLWYLCGKQAKAVMDDEACNILMDYLESYYYDSSLEEDEYFARAFAHTGDRIMMVTRSPLPMILVMVLAVVLMLLGYFWWKKAKQQKLLEAEKAAEILNTPLETFGDSQAEDLAKKYENQDTKQ